MTLSERIGFDRLTVSSLFCEWEVITLRGHMNMIDDFIDFIRQYLQQQSDQVTLRLSFSITTQCAVCVFS